ncbi:hypothetical protein SAMN05892883_2493 [Jatrophihabitans sp. GAS493]|uniref:hypothetical protein n=1 Tax=Jatrophihabitans sp. GAS493 TaxID=1907575 RepID=UPI000BC0319B|nr:hypothetical protein [Jatrophihabitans sp. GAS493]SOD73202.1 hypothetical protein SAMN05892883_2493 [Jatrophihabitans sp. GAS493]
MTSPHDDGKVRAPATAESPVTPERSEIRQAAGIYGLIVTAAVLATAGSHLSTLALELAVFLTLIVYWLAEEYAQLGEHISGGHLPTWHHIGSALVAKWPMVSASYIPLLALLADRLIGGSPTTAAYVALAVTVGMLTYYGWSAGRNAQLRGLSLFLMTFAACALGMLMIGLKILITHLH